MMSIFSSTSFKGEDPWWIDSGASSHMTSKREFFSFLLSYEGPIKSIYTTNDEACKIEGVGCIPLCLGSSKKINIEGVLYIPTITKNLLSVGQMVDNGYNVDFASNECFIRNKGNIVAKGTRLGKLYK